MIGLQVPQKLMYERDGVTGHLLFQEFMPDGITPVRYFALHGGRGSAKSWSVAQALLLEGSMTPIRTLCTRQLQNSIDESVHRLLSDQIYAMNLHDKYHVKKTYITGPDGTEFVFEGIQHNINKIRSFEGVDRCWVEEANGVTRNSWEVLTPTIRKPGSKIIVTFNPELEDDYTYQRFVARPAKDCWTVEMNWRDNPWFPDVLRREMEEMRSTDYDAYLNVWEGKCRQMLDGVVFMNELRQCEAQGRICKVPYNPQYPVDTFWDLGRRDMTSIWFVQRIGFEWRIIDFHQSSMKDLPFYLKLLRAKSYVYGTDYLPHDAANENAAALATGKTIKKLMQEAGRTVKIVAKLSLADGINAVRTVFPLCYFDTESCKEGLQMLRHYRYDVDEESKLLSKVPRHDQYSHAADAFRYFAVAAREPKTHDGQLARRGKQKADRLRRGNGALGWLGR